MPRDTHAVHSSSYLGIIEEDADVPGHSGGRHDGINKLYVRHRDFALNVRRAYHNNLCFVSI